MAETNKNFKMKPWHYDFCREYLMHGRNGTEAFLAVRPNVKHASARVCSCELLKHAEIKEEIKHVEEEIAKSNKVDMQKRLEVLSQIILTGSESNRIKAIEVMNKMEGIGVNSPNQVINVNSNPMFEKFSEDDLMRFISNDEEDDDDD